MSFFRSLSCILENQEIILQTVDILHLPALYVKWLTDNLLHSLKLVSKKEPSGILGGKGISSSQLIAGEIRS